MHIAQRPPDPDPHNVILHRLEADPVFATLPPRSERSGHIVDQAAFYQSEPFEGGSSWQGPTVTEYFVTDLSYSQLIAAVNVMAIAAGWSRNTEFSWVKEVDGTMVSLGVGPVATSGPYAYELSASA